MLSGFAATARPIKVAKELAVGTRVLQFQARHGLIKPLIVGQQLLCFLHVGRRMGGEAGWQGVGAAGLTPKAGKGGGPIC